MPDAIRMLKDDHQTVKRLLKEYEALGDADLAQKRRMAERIVAELLVHERIEEDVFYPAYKEAADEEGRELVAESKEEHGVVDTLIAQLQDVDLSDERFDAKMKVLKENVEHHIEEEEEKMFPWAAEALGARLEELGEVMQELKVSLQRELKPAREAGGTRSRGR